MESNQNQQKNQFQNLQEKAKSAFDSFARTSQTQIKNILDRLKNKKAGSDSNFVEPEVITPNNHAQKPKSNVPIASYIPDQYNGQLQTGNSMPAANNQQAANISQKQGFKQKQKKKKPIQSLINTIIIFAGFIVLLVIFAGFVHLSNFDNQFFNLSISGTVTDFRGQPVPSAEIFINDVFVGKTNENGFYKIDKLSESFVDFLVKKPEYEDFYEEIRIQNGFLDYSIEKDVTLNKANVATVRGKFIAPDETYNFANDRIIINNQEYRIENDGSFNIEDDIAGEQVFEFSSLNFRDISVDVTIPENQVTQINEYTLVPAGDILGTFEDYVTEQPITNVSILAEEIDPEAISISESGEFAIKDLEIGNEISLRIVSEGYETRDYEFRINQGENLVPDLKMIKTLEVVYLGQVENQENLDGVIRSSLDGKNTRLVDAITNLDPNEIFFDEQSGKIFFTSDEDNIRGVVDNRLDAIYEYILSSSRVNLLTPTDEEIIGSIYTNLKSNKYLDIYSEGRNDDSRELFIANFNNTERRKISNLSNFEILEIGLSESANRIVYLEEQNNDQRVIKTVSADGGSTEIVAEGLEDLDLLDISPDGDTIIYSKINDTTELNDLFAYKQSTKQTTTLARDFRGSFTQFYSNETLIYADEVNNKFGIYSINLQNTQKTELIELNVRDEITGIYKQAGLIYYVIEDKGLYVMDLGFPNSYKLVINGDFESL